MKNYLFLLMISLLFFGCSPNSPINNNPYLPNYAVNLDINLNLAQYSDLKFPSNAVYIPNQGVRGIIVFNVSGTTYNAFDAACPNQALSDCSRITIKGIMAICACDNAEYNLFTGQSTGKPYPLKQYRVEVNGNVLKVYN